MKNRIISMLIVLCMVFSFFPVSALAEEPGADDLAWEETNDFVFGNVGDGYFHVVQQSNVMFTVAEHRNIFYQDHVLVVRAYGQVVLK